MKSTVEALKTGGEKEFQEVFDAYHHRLYFFLKKMGCDDYEAEEMVQETFIKLFKFIPTLKEELEFSTQLFQISKTTYIDYLRKKKIDIIQLSESMVAIPEVKEEDTKIDLIEKIKTAVESLPSKCREIFLLSRRDRLSYTEIANKLLISPKTVENQIGKALKTIRYKIKQTSFLFLLFIGLH